MIARLWTMCVAVVLLAACDGGVVRGSAGPGPARSDAGTDPAADAGPGGDAGPGQDAGPACLRTGCAQGSFCDPNTGQCVLGCDKSDDCPQPGACNMNTRRCVCAPGYHQCGLFCSSNDQLATCGARCDPCPTDPHGTATCDGTSCRLSCEQGFRECSGACASCPTGATIASFACDGSRCVAGSCSGANHVCSGACVADMSTDHCGSRCTACPTDPNGTASCDGDDCALTCKADYRLCSGRCAPCPTGAGTASTACALDFCVAATCAPGYHLCGGSCASDRSTESCGLSCGACADDPHGAPTCDGTSCGIACDQDYRLCQGGCASCPTGAGIASTACSGAACAIATCAGGYRLCGAGCAACPGGAGIASYDCSASACVVASCQQGYRLCGGGCAACPTGPGVTSLACAGPACVAASCAFGYRWCSTGCCAWTIEQIDAGVDAPSAALDRAGRPHVAYIFDYERLRYARWTGSAWQKIDVPGTVEWPWRASRPALAVDASTEAHLAFIWQNRLKTTRTTGGTWASSLEGVDSSSSVKDVSMAVGLDGVERIAYADDDCGFVLAIRDGAPWTRDTIQCETSESWHVSLAMNGGGEPRIILASWWSTAKYASPASSGWNLESVSDAAQNLVLDLDSSGMPQLVGVGRQYEYLNPPFPLRYGRRAGSTWTWEDIGKSQRDTSFSFDVAGDTPFVAYATFEDGDAEIKLAERVGSSWRYSKVALVFVPSISWERSISLRVDASGTPHLFFIDEYGALYYAH